MNKESILKYLADVKNKYQNEAELSQVLGLPVDLADSAGMSKTGKKFIIDRAIYV